MGVLYWNLNSLLSKLDIENVWFVEILGFPLDYYLRSYSASAGETSGHFLLNFLNLLSATASVPLLNHFLTHPGSRSWSHEFHNSDLRSLGIFFPFSSFMNPNKGTFTLALCVGIIGGTTFWRFPSKHSSWWRCLEDVFRLRLQKTSSKRLDQDEYVRLSLTSSEDVFKTNIFVLAICLQEVFKTFSRGL